MRRKNLFWTSIVTLLLTIAALAGTVPVTSVGMPTMSVVPPLVEGYLNYPTDSTFDVNVTVTHIIAQEDLYAWEFKLHFNPGLLNITDVTRGEFLGTAGPTEWEAGGLGPTWDNDFGYAVVHDMLQDISTPGQGATGDGVLATISFKVTGYGICFLDLDETELWTIKGTPPEIIEYPIGHKVEDGLFDNREENVLPTAAFDVTHPGMLMPVVGQPVNFDASNSSDDGWLVSYDWDFGERPQTTDSGMVVDHVFTKVGTYTVSLTVTDNNGGSDTQSSSIEVVKWMEGGNFPDILKAWAEHHEWNEVAKGRDLPLNALIGNPTENWFEVKVKFEIFSKEEGAKLGTIETDFGVIGPGAEVQLDAIMDLRESTWRLLRPPHEAYWCNARLSVNHRYSAFATCYYKPLGGEEPNKGLATVDCSWKILGAVHDIAVLEVTTNATNGVPKGDPLEICVTLDNQGGNYDEYFNLVVTYKGTAAQGTVVEMETSLGHQETRTESFTLDTSSLPAGRYLIKAEVDRLTFEEDVFDNVGQCFVSVIE